MHDSHEFFLPFGPQHPALVEPAHIKLRVDGETIAGAELVLGYNHKGIEKSFESRTWTKGVYLSERCCGICGHYHTSCYCQGIEQMMGVEIPGRAQHIRVIIAELERMHSHMLALGLIGWEIGLDTLFHYVFRDRELAMESQELLTGNRVHFAMNVIGGVHRDISEDNAKRVIENLDKLDDRLRHYVKIFRSDSSVRNRTRHVGVLSRQAAREFCSPGPNVRASGVDYDVRETGYLAYKDLKFRAVTGQGGDVLERCLVRLKECLESSRMIRLSLSSMPKGEIALKLPAEISVKEGSETVARVEAPRGELFYYLKSGGDRPYRVKIRTPTYQTFHVLEEVLKGGRISDAPVIVASLDPCFSCTDRMTLVDARTREERIVTKHDILHMGGGLPLHGRHGGGGHG